MVVRPLAAVALGLALLAGPALADEKLPPEQQTKVEDLLKKEGFTKWKEIEVDDAIDADGKQFDLELDPKSLEIVKRKAE